MILPADISAQQERNLAKSRSVGNRNFQTCVTRKSNRASYRVCIGNNTQNKGGTAFIDNAPLSTK